MADTIFNVKFVKEVQKYPCLYNADIAAYSRKDITEEAWMQIGKLMNMTAIACKDKWRNLRVVFIRHLKQAALSDKKRKPYYLFDEMRFLIPYLKLNFSVPKDLILTNTIIQMNERTNDIELNESSGEVNQIANQEFIEEIKCELDDSSDGTYIDNEPVQESQTRKRTTDEPDIHIINNMRKNSRREPDANECGSPQMNDSMVLCSNSNKNVRCDQNDSVNYNNDPVVSFLNSILPELNEMNLKQFKIFKRRVLALIDDIKPDED